SIVNFIDIGNKVEMFSRDIGRKSNVEPKISDLGLSRKINVQSNVNKGIYEWKIIFDKPTKELNSNELEIKNKFLKADEFIPTQSTKFQQHQDAIYISQFIDTSKILEVN
ncbi:19281_t:CDS:2, partial [Racocetra fulgida]